MEISINVYIICANRECAHIEQLLSLSKCLQRSLADEGKDKVPRFDIFIVYIVKPFAAVITSILILLLYVAVCVWHLNSSNIKGHITLYKQFRPWNYCSINTWCISLKRSLYNWNRTFQTELSICNIQQRTVKNVMDNI